jgi:tetratricopeptide (TPR) repeat protein
VTGDLKQAKLNYLKSANAAERAGSPRVNVLVTETEALRIEEKLGGAAVVLPEISRRLNEVRGWWKRYQNGETVPEAPQPVILARSLISVLNIATITNAALARWQTCLELVRESEETARRMGQTNLELAEIRFNGHGALIGLGRLDEAQTCVEACLGIFRAHGSVAAEAGALSALASIWRNRGDLGQALALERQVLSLYDRLPDPADRAAAHANLGNCLEEASQQSQAARHRVAAAAYCVVSGHAKFFSAWQSNLAGGMCRSALRGERYQLPRLSELLGDPEFDALRRFLAGRRADLSKLQSAIDHLAHQAYQLMLSTADSSLMPPEVQAICQCLQKAAAAHQPLEPILAELRSAMLKAAPGTEALADAVIAQLCQELEKLQR